MMLMSWNLPVSCVAEIAGVNPNTDLLWRRKAFAAGKSRATSSSIARGLDGAIDPGATVVHDGLFQHRKLIEGFGCRDEVYKSTVKGEASLRAMLPINSFCSWAQRYLNRFYGMKPEYLQQYLDWFVYAFRVKKRTRNGRRRGDWCAIRYFLRRFGPEKCETIGFIETQFGSFLELI